MQEATKELNQAAEDAYDLVQTYANIDDPYDENDAQNPWNQPDELFRQLQAARERLVTAWEQIGRIHKQTEESSSPMEPKTKDEFRALYMDMITDAFADILEDMRQADDMDVDILVECLQSGIDLMDQDEWTVFQDLNVADTGEEAMEEEEEETNKLTPHQLRRMECGYKDLPVL